MATDAIVTLSKLTYYDGKIKAWVNTELNEAIAGLGNIFTLKGSVDSIDALPATDNESGDIYIVGTAAPYDEYYWDGTKWELMGTTATDISGVVTKAALYEGADGTGTVAAPADGTIVKTIYDKISAVQAEVDAVEERVGANETAIATNTVNIKTNTDAIAAINNADTGILAQAKAYADGKDTAIQAAQDAADAAQGEVDALETLVGAIPEGATATTVTAYAKELADANTTAINTINETLNNTVTESDIDSLFAGM